MRLSPLTADPLQRDADAVLDRRLRRDLPRPVAVAISGGGDSLALLLLAAAWARAAGRPLLALHVDHGLQAASAAWTGLCAQRAQALGADFQALRWTGEKPSTGLPAAARRARHALIAQAARAADCRVILLGHTADDVAEAARMRAEGSTTPTPREWSPSPAWPEGRGLFLLRPLLATPRAAIRDWLAARGETWIDDPANDDLRYARARARHTPGPATVVAAPTEDPTLAILARAAEPLPGDGLAIDRAALRAAPITAAARFIAAACLCAAGTTRPPAGSRVRDLGGRLRDEEVFVATLAGARIEADARQVRVVREAGEAARGGLAPLHLAAGETGVWDGRFEIATDHPIEVGALRGHARRLPQARALARLPAAARPGLPLIEGESPALGPVAGVACRALAYDRLLAACGAVESEPAR